MLNGQNMRGNNFVGGRKHSQKHFKRKEVAHHLKGIKCVAAFLQKNFLMLKFNDF